MSLYFDNIFTSNLFTGPDNGLTNSDLNSKLWTTLPIDRQYPSINFGKGSFFIVKKFNSSDSSIINNALKSAIPQTVYFDSFGNLTIYKLPVSQSKETSLAYLNLTSYGGTVNYLSPKGVIDFTNFKVFENKNLLMSDENKYILDLRNTSEIKILYNPMHRESLQKFYKSKAVFINDNGYNTPNTNNTDNMSQLVDKYCEIMAIKNSANGDRKYSDSICKCLGTDNNKTWPPGSGDPVGECVDEVIGHIAEPNIRGNVGYNCVCGAQSCKNIPSTSFAQNFITTIKGKLPTCPDIKTTVCSLVVQAGGGIKADNTTLNQSCGNNEDYKNAKIASDKAAADKVAADKAAADKVAADKAAADKVAADKAAADKVAADKAAADKAAADKVAADKAAADKAAADKAVVDKAAADKAAADQAAADKAVADKAVADKAAADKAAADKAAADQAAADKIIPSTSTTLSAADRLAAYKATTAAKALLDKAAIDKAVADKAAIDKAAANKAAADKATANSTNKTVVNVTQAPTDNSLPFNLTIEQILIISGFVAVIVAIILFSKKK